MSSDRLLRHIELLQGDAPWGDVLDAGTGKRTLPWITGLPTTSWTAVTREPNVRAQLVDSIPWRKKDEFIVGDWTDPALLLGRAFDVVVADTLLPAIETTAPYFQGRLFERLRPHVRSRLYVVGLEPWPERGATTAEDVVLESVRLRDAALQLAGHRPYREFPMSWVARQLDKLGFVLVDAKHFSITHSARSIERVLAVVGEVAPRIPDAEAAQALTKYASRLGERARWMHEQHGGFKFGQHYVIAARRP